MIGTPLELKPVGSGRGHRSVRPSAADKIAPTLAMFERFHEREMHQRERQLLAEAAKGEVTPSNLYEEGSLFKKQFVTAVDIMDDEDRAQAYLRARTRGRRSMQVSGGTESELMPRPFGVACTLTPDVVPKAQVTSVGSDILRECKKISGRRTRHSRFQAQTVGPIYQSLSSSLISSAVRNPKDVRGIGWSGSDRNAVNEQGIAVRRGKDTTLVQSGIAEEPYLDDMEDDGLANTGYKDLDTANERMKLAMLKRRRSIVRKEKAKKQKNLEAAGQKESDRVLFSLFERGEVLEFSREQGNTSPESIPPDFVKNPVHSRQTDECDALQNMLPNSLLKEHESLMRQRERELIFESKAVNRSMAIAKRKRDEKLLVLKQQFLEDMSSKFVPARGRQEDVYDHCFRPADQDSDGGRNVSLPAEDYLTEVGTSRRTEHQWYPCPLLFKLYGIVPTKNEKQGQANDQNDKRMRSSLTTRHEVEDDDFQVHAIIGADGKRIDFQHAARAFVEDDSVALTIAESQKGIGTLPVSATPSAELYNAIYNRKVSHADATNGDADVRVSAQEGKQTQLAGGRTSRRTKAADFF